MLVPVAEITARLEILDGFLAVMDEMEELTGPARTAADLAGHDAGAFRIMTMRLDALATVDPTRYFQKYGANAWAAVKGYLDEVANTAAAPVI